MKNHRGRVSAPADGAAWIVTRREFLRNAAAGVAGLCAGVPFGQAASAAAKLSFGIVTDAHFADTDNRGTRRYRESVAKMTECVALMNDKRVDFLIELGDFKDQGTPSSEASTLTYLETIEKVFGAFRGPRYHVLGNHDVDSLSKEQFQARVQNTGIPQAVTYYSFDMKGLHAVVLDANYDTAGSDYDHGRFDWRDSNIPDKELEWLRKDLEASSVPVVVFIHQQLDVPGSAGVRNAESVRRVLQESKNVLAVFQGHHHPGHYSRISNIHYYTLRAMVEGGGKANNSYAVVDVHEDSSMVITGYRRAAGRKMERA